MSGVETPTKKVPVMGFSPVFLPQSPIASPQKHLTGPPRILRDIVADLYNNIQKWNNLHIEGSQLVKNIALIKSDILGSYSSELEEKTNKLYETVQLIKAFVNIFENIKNQVNALEKLQNGNEAIFLSCTINQIQQSVERVIVAYLKEYKVKVMVLENIAHSKNKDELMFLAACWTFQPYITKDVNLKLQALLVETGHRAYQYQ